MGSYVASTSAKQNPDGTYSAVVTGQSNDKKTSSVVRVTAKTQQDAMEQAQHYSQLASASTQQGSLTLPLTAPDSDLLNVTMENATQGASGAITTQGVNAFYEPGHSGVTGVNPPQPAAASSLSGALESVNNTLSKQIGSAFDLDKSEIETSLENMSW